MLRRQFIKDALHTIFLPIIGGPVENKETPEPEEPPSAYGSVPYANVADYGTLGTGDDTAVFQAALDDNENGRLYVPKGSYRVNWVIDKPCTILSDATLFTANRNLPCVRVGDGQSVLEHVVIEKLSVRGDGDYPEFAKIGVQISEGVARSQFSNISSVAFSESLLKISHENATLPTFFNFYSNLDLYAAVMPGCEAALDVRFGNGAAGYTTAQYFNNMVIRGVPASKGKSLRLHGSRIFVSHTWIECEHESGIATSATANGLNPKMICNGVVVDSPNKTDVLLETHFNYKLASEVVVGTVNVDGILRDAAGNTMDISAARMHIPYKSQIAYPDLWGNIGSIP